MFQVELIPGKERSYVTLAEFTAAMRNGEINSGSRIFHRTASSWLPITEHPEYRKFLEERHTPPRLDPAIPLEPFRLLTVPNEPGMLRTLAERGAALATSGWASIKRRLDFGISKSAGLLRPARSPLPAPPVKPAKSETPRRSASQLKRVKPSQSAVPPEPSTPARPATPAQAATPGQAAKSPAPAKSSRPVPSSQPSPAAPRNADSNRARWTFYP